MQAADREHVRACRGSRQSQLTEGRMCPLPLPGRSRLLYEDPNRTRRNSSVEQGQWAAHKLRAGSGKIPPGHQADITLCIPRSATARGELTWRYPLMCRRPALLVRPPGGGTCGTVHSMNLALGLASRLDIRVTIPLTMLPGKNVGKNRPGNHHVSDYLPANRPPSSSHAVLGLRSQELARLDAV